MVYGRMQAVPVVSIVAVLVLALFADEDENGGRSRLRNGISCENENSDGWRRSEGCSWGWEGLGAAQDDAEPGGEPLADGWWGTSESGPGGFHFTSWGEGDEDPDAPAYEFDYDWDYDCYEEYDSDDWFDTEDTSSDWYDDDWF